MSISEQPLSKRRGLPDAVTGNVEIGWRKLPDREPELLYDGEVIAPDSPVTMPAWGIAELAYRSATAVVASRRIHKSILRNPAGQIVSIVEEPTIVSLDPAP